MTETPSFEYPENFAHQILTTCGPGRILDVGSGMGTLVRELLKQGADAFGVDVSSVVAAHCNRYVPGRFFAGSILKLPFQDESFDTLISTDCLEHLAPKDVPLALREMRRVCRRNLFLRIATVPDRDGHWHLTIEKRGWWEDVAFAAGFRKHPQYYEITPFHALEVEGNTITIPLEKVPDDALALYPLSKLLEHRELHMDMSRETGRRSDAHMVRYHLAANYVRDGDTVLDSACGMGYGSRLLAWQSGAARVIGIDLDQEAVLYATENFAQGERRVSFQAADVLRLDFLADNSIDLFVSFETLEHVPYPDRLIAEAKRILRPGGRFMVSVPNQWVNEDGIDPNPYHLHVYDWKRLTQELRPDFLLEAAYAQTAGGGMKLTNCPRTLLSFSPQDNPPEQAEWWLIVAMKDPVGAESIPYEESALYWEAPVPNVAAFARDYANPWLVRGLIAIGWRNSNAVQVADMAKRELEIAPAGSTDAGAALCILAYRLLDSPETLTPSAVAGVSDQIDHHMAVAGHSSQSQRWVISLLYVQGLLWQASGRRDRALDSFAACADADPLVYSPLIATKTVDACRLAGILRFQDKDEDGASKFWLRGIAQAELALHGDWREIHGGSDRPLPFGLREAAQILDCANRCAENLNHLAVHGTRRGIPDESSFTVRLETSNARLDESLRDLQALQSSPYLRLRRAMETDPPSLRRVARIVYLLAIILLPPRLKTLLRPLAASLRKRFQ